MRIFSSRPLGTLRFSVIFVAVGLGLLAQAGVSGLWVYRVPTGDGNFRDTFFELTQSGESVGGTFYSGTRQIPLTEGTFKDGKLRFVVNLGNENMARPVVYEGTLANGRIEMSALSPSGNRPPTTGVAEHARREAMLPPARLPLPELRQVPDNGLVRTPPMGWNSWNLFADKVDDRTVREIADAMVSSGMREAGYVYVNIDDTWEAPHRDDRGNIASNVKFPNMKALADYVHSKGLKIGIYSSPGPKTCAGYEGSYGHETQDAQTFAAWGIDYLKYDWCSASQIYKDEDMQGVYQKMGDALLKTGRPIVYSLCQYGRADVWEWGAKVGGNCWRTTGDISDHWQSVDNIGFHQVEIAPYATSGHFNDPDMLEIGNGGMNREEYRTHMSLWSLLAAPLLAGNDLRKMTPETKSILMNREVIAIDQDPAVNPVKQVSQDGKAVVLARLLKDNSWAVGLFNRGDRPASVVLKWEALGFGGKPLQVRDLWRRQPVETSGSGYSAKVPAHGVVLLRVTAL